MKYELLIYLNWFTKNKYLYRNFTFWCIKVIRPEYYIVYLCKAQFQYIYIYITLCSNKFQGVPRFAFITWLAVKDRLATGHRSRRWSQPQHCLYCGEPDETRDHLFFACPYTFTLWLKMVGNLFGTDSDPDWDITLSTMLSRS